MKKLLAIIIAALMICMLASCKKDDNKNLDDTGDDTRAETSADNDTFTYEIGKGDTAIITGYTGSYSLHTVEVPDMIDGREVVGIGTKAFYYNSAITAVTLPATVTSIGDYA